jgi:hypothetical protein
MRGRVLRPRVSEISSGHRLSRGFAERARDSPSSGRQPCACRADASEGLELSREVRQGAAELVNDGCGERQCVLLRGHLNFIPLSTHRIACYDGAVRRLRAARDSALGPSDAAQLPSRSSTICELALVQRGIACRTARHILRAGSDSRGHVVLGEENRPAARTADRRLTMVLCFWRARE